jgi:hypothetical protein
MRKGLSLPMLFMHLCGAELQVSLHIAEEQDHLHCKANLLREVNLVDCC